MNRDVVAEVAALPRTGQTVLADQVRRNVGGKGANQAVAARRFGAEVHLVARTGDDAAAAWLRCGLSSAGVRVDGVREVPGTRSGTAYITVAGGENTIVVDAGANHAWPDGLGPDAALVRAANCLVLQQEVAPAVNERAAAATRGRVILNAAPSRPGSPPARLLRRCDPLVVNEHELGELCPCDVEDAMRELIGRGAVSVVTTLGAAGAVWCDAAGCGRVAAPTVDAVDSTGAGDGFVGVLAAELSAGAPLPDAVRWAVAAASASVRFPGTHGSYPDRATVARLR